MAQQELQAREQNDRLLQAVGGQVQNTANTQITAASGLTGRESPLPGNDLAQKITFCTTGTRPKDLSKAVRTSPMQPVGFFDQINANGVFEEDKTDARPMGRKRSLSTSRPAISSGEGDY